MWPVVPSAGNWGGTTPYAHAMTYFLLGHDDTQDFGRKFKVAFSGCGDNACGLTNFHDLGAIAREWMPDVMVVSRWPWRMLAGRSLKAIFAAPFRCVNETPSGCTRMILQS